MMVGLNQNLIKIVLLYERDTRKVNFLIRGNHGGDEKLIYQILNGFVNLLLSPGFINNVIKHAFSKRKVKPNDPNRAPIWRPEKDEFMQA